MCSEWKHCQKASTLVHTGASGTGCFSVPTHACSLAPLSSVQPVQPSPAASCMERTVTEVVSTGESKHLEECVPMAHRRGPWGWEGRVNPSSRWQRLGCSERRSGFAEPGRGAFNILEPFHLPLSLSRLTPPLPLPLGSCDTDASYVTGTHSHGSPWVAFLVP